VEGLEHELVVEKPSDCEGLQRSCYNTKRCKNQPIQQFSSHNHVVKMITYIVLCKKQHIVGKSNAILFVLCFDLKEGILYFTKSEAAVII
jgi:hypothetical protein